MAPNTPGLSLNLLCVRVTSAGAHLLVSMEATVGITTNSGAEWGTAASGEDNTDETISIGEIMALETKDGKAIIHITILE